MKKLFVVAMMAMLATMAIGSPVPQESSQPPASAASDECTDICPANYAPVCGTDDVSYSNVCLLNHKACKSGQKISVKSPGQCGAAKPDDENECSRKCASTFEPVCGSDGLTYNNECQFKQGVCRNPSLTKESEGPCIAVNIKQHGVDANEDNDDINDDDDDSSDDEDEDMKDKVSQLDGKHPCNQICNRNHKPVCGSNGKTYSNMCLLEVESCLDSSVSLAHEGDCNQSLTQLTELTTVRIVSKRAAQSGDQKQHQQQQQQQQQHQKQAGQSEEQDDDAEASETSTQGSECQLFCALIWKPVCGTDRRTYGNECDLTAKACFNKSNVTLLHEGECQSSAEDTLLFAPVVADQLDQQDLCPEKCPADDLHDPVCGSDGITYQNECMIHQANCISNRNLRLAHRGSCPGRCDSIKCDYDLSPVCGTDGITYSNQCNLLGTACALGLNDLDIRHIGRCSPAAAEAVVAEEEACNMVCSLEYRPVCGTDGLTYSNACKFQQAKCEANLRGDHIDLMSESEC